MFKNNGIKTLSHPTRYLYQIRKLVENSREYGSSQLFSQMQDGVPLFNFYFDANNLANAIAIEIRKGRYHLTRPQQRIIKSKTKNRIIYDYPLTDKIVLGVLSQVLNELLEKVMSDKSYAFRSGKKTLDVLNNWSRYIRNHRKQQIDAFYFFRTDFVAYSDEIDVKQSSQFWTNLLELFKLLKVKPTPYQWDLIVSAIRPEFYNLDGHLQCNLSGVPTGTAIVTFTNNFYAYKIDNVIGADEQLFYVRYCDDILICHPDKDILLHYKDKLTEMIESLSLRTNKKKDFLGYFTTSGIASTDPQFVGCNSFDYLGYRMFADATYSLSKHRQRKFLRRVFQYIRNIRLSANYRNPTHAGKVICEALNDVFTKKALGENNILALIRDCSNHSQLKHLDYLITLRIAETLSGIKGVKAFRKFTYKFIKRELKLKSLVNLRNRGIL